MKMFNASLAAGFKVSCAALIAAYISGCVPIPFRPSATVAHTPITTHASSVILLDTYSDYTLAKAVAKSVQHAEPRVVLVDGTAFMQGAQPEGYRLADVVDAAERAERPPLTADYLLSVGVPKNRQLHDTGAVGTLPFAPVVVVGYEKVQSVETLSASFLDLRTPHEVDGLSVSSAYSEVATGLVYGVMTIAMPEAAVREALARDVAHRLAEAQPAGSIRLTVLGQNAFEHQPPVVKKAQSDKSPIPMVGNLLAARWQIDVIGCPLRHSVPLEVSPQPAGYISMRAARIEFHTPPVRSAATGETTPESSFDLPFAAVLPTTETITGSDEKTWVELRQEDGSCIYISGTAQNWSAEDARSFAAALSEHAVATVSDATQPTREQP